MTRSHCAAPATAARSSSPILDRVASDSISRSSGAAPRPAATAAALPQVVGRLASPAMLREQRLRTPIPRIRCLERPGDLIPRIRGRGPRDGVAVPRGACRLGLRLGKARREVAPEPVVRIARGDELPALRGGGVRSGCRRTAVIVSASMPRPNGPIGLGASDQPQDPAAEGPVAALDHQRCERERGGRRHDRRGRIAAPQAELGGDHVGSRIVTIVEPQLVEGRLRRIEPAHRRVVEGPGDLQAVTAAAADAIVVRRFVEHAAPLVPAPRQPEIERSPRRHREGRQPELARDRDRLRHEEVGCPTSLPGAFEHPTGIHVHGADDVAIAGLARDGKRDLHLVPRLARVVLPETIQLEAAARECLDPSIADLDCHLDGLFVRRRRFVRAVQVVQVASQVGECEGSQP